jgi:hypothetical protein
MVAMSEQNVHLLLNAESMNFLHLPAERIPGQQRSTNNQPMLRHGSPEFNWQAEFVILQTPVQRLLQEPDPFASDIRAGSNSCFRELVRQHEVRHAPREFRARLLAEPGKFGLA